MDDAYYFESIVRMAFDCERSDFRFANADYFSSNVFCNDKKGAGLAKLNSIMICALYALRKKYKDDLAKQAIIDECREKLTQYDIDQKYSYESLNDILYVLHDKEIVG